MENYSEKLQELILLKKTKKELNVQERKEFKKAWINCIDVEGYSDNTEFYLYNGFIYCGAEPFKDYIQSKSDTEKELDKLYKGKLYGDNCATTSPILISLLCLCLNDANQNLTVINSLISHIPEALNNKEGVIYRHAGRAFKKYFLDKLASGISIPDFTTLEEHGLSQTETTEFIQALTAVLETIDLTKATVTCQLNAKKISNWLSFKNKDSDLGKASESSETEKINKDDQICLDKEKNLEIATLPALNSENANACSSEIEKIQIKKYESLFTELKEIEKELINIKQQLVKSTYQNEELSNKIIEEKQIIQNMEKENLQLKSQIRNSEKHLDFLRDQLLESQGKYASQSEMIEMIKRDQSKRMEESQKRIASSLKTYYEDFINSQDLEMSLELGENFRDQIGDLFKILKKSGIQL